MPQGKRRLPFSGKAKKDQLKEKKQNKNSKQVSGEGSKNTIVVQSSGSANAYNETQKINFQASQSSRSQANRYALQFHRETNEEIQKRKVFAQQSLEYREEKDLEINVEEYFLEDLDFPKRPKWSFNESSENLNMRENKYFQEYISSIEKKFDWKELSYFELNLETWRQLWRVLEMSDIVLIIVDIRYPACMFPPSLYDYVVNTLKKDIILVLNKIDLAPVEVVVAWKVYFEEKYPKLHVVLFTSLPDYNLMGKQSNKAGLQIRRKKGKIRMAAEGTQLLFKACQDIVGDGVDLSSWNDKIKEEMNQEYSNDDDDNVDIQEVININKVDTGYFEHEKYKNGILTIGCLGQPNVGKSSLLNAIMGKKVVSVSKTPGHTKHFQTIFLTKNVRLCDCPGIVFPSKVPKPIQILMGSFPIAQLREPYTTIRYLAEHLNLPHLLQIEHPDNDNVWSAMDVCDGWAKKRRYYTKKGARLDTSRAANDLLRMALDGKISICLRPPHFLEKKEFWKNHSDIDKVRWIQARSSDETTSNYVKFEEKSDEEEESSSHTDVEDNPSSDGTSSDDDNDEQPSLVYNKFSALNQT